MTRYRAWMLIGVSLALVITIMQVARSQSRWTLLPTSQSVPVQENQPAKVSDTTGLVRTIYALGDDPKFAEWIAATIPEMIASGSWDLDGRQVPRLRYYAPGRLLVVNHTAAVHAEVEAFLKDLQKVLPKGTEKTGVTAGKGQPDLLPASYSAPSPVKPAEPRELKEPTRLVPSQRQQPKHLFHFIIRYEGDGIIDTNVADVLKTVYGPNAAKEDKPEKAGTEPADPKSTKSPVTVVTPPPPPK